MFWYRLHRLFIILYSLPLNYLRLLLNGVKVGIGFRCCGNLFVRNGGEMILGKNISINSHRIADPIGGDTKTILICGNGGKLILHDGVSMSNACLFASKHIEIGEQTCIGGGVKIYDSDFHSILPEKRLNGNADVPTNPIIIGKRVFIGGHSIILKGVIIGDDSVIGAGSVVTKNIPCGEVWAGNPARFLKKVYG